LALSATQAGDCFLSDLDSNNRTQTRAMTLTVPVGAVGALILDIDVAGSLLPLFRTWVRSGRTGESYLVRSTDRHTIWYLTPLRNAPPGQSPVSRSVDSAQFPANERLDNAFLIEGLDYRGVLALTQARPVPETDWYVIVKMDKEEVDAPVVRLGKEISVVLVLLLLLNVAGASVIWNFRQLRLQRESEERFRAIADDTPAFLWMLSQSRNEFFINKALSTFLGINDDKSASGWTDFLHPEDSGRVVANLAHCVELRLPFEDEARLRRADGEYRWVAGRGQARLSPDMQFHGYTGALLDITDRRNAEQQLRSSNSALAREVAERTRREAEIRALSARLFDAQQEERTRVARELHDDLSQEIAALSISLGNLKRGLPEELEAPRGQSDRIQKRLVNLSESVRRISHQLHPSALTHSGLATALRNYCGEFEKLTDIRVRFQADGTFSRVPLPVASHLYRICQEALRNVARHAKTDSAEVRIRWADDVLLFSVEDHGAGFDPSELEHPGGLGLVSIRERARLVNGTVDVQSSPGKGTCITVRVPVPADTPETDQTT
jgi:PAS domain S-box-containing protein